MLTVVKSKNIIGYKLQNQWWKNCRRSLSFYRLSFLLNQIGCGSLARSQHGCRYKDTITISIKFKDGSIGNINYYSNGNPKYSKENIEIFTGNKILKIENFIKLSGYGWNNLNQRNCGCKIKVIKSN